ncbi:MAG: ABC transporter substrate-binding protein [Rubrivivax sp.]|nr:ABC transporter substrate-binding protein [Rubrivivax sp.]
MPKACAPASASHRPLAPARAARGFASLAAAALLCAGAAATATPPPSPRAARPGPGSASREAAALVIHDDRGRRVALKAPAQRIVSLLPSLTETLCELGACARLVGTDRYSNWPPAVRALPKLGGLEDAQVERIVALKPDLVLVANAPRLVERLESLGLPVAVLIPQTLADARRVAGVVGTAALGDAAAGERLWQRLDARIAAAAARAPAALRGQRLYVEVASAPFAAGEASFVGALVARLGLANVVPATLGAFPQLNPEFVLRADPDIVIATEAALAEMPLRPGWAGLRALREGHACGLPPPAWDTLVRSGPRLAEAAEAIVECLQRLGAAPRAQR